MNGGYLAIRLIVAFVFASLFYINISYATSITTTTETKVTYVDGIIKVEDNKVEFLHNDYLGTTRRVSDATTGEQTLSSDYYYFGGELDKTGYSAEYGSSLKKAFTSKEQDDKSGLYYFGARYYNPSVGRFTSVDPVYDPKITTYHYSLNNPLKFIDPDGEDIEFATRISENEKVKNLYSVAGSTMYKILAITYDTNIHEFSNRDKNKDYEMYYKKALENIPSRGVAAITVSGTLSLFDLDKINSYGQLSDMVLLTYLLHESIHQYDISEGEFTGQKHPKTVTIKKELDIQNEIYNSLELDKTYDNQLKNKNSWVVKSKISKKDYKDLAKINKELIKLYEDKIDKEGIKPDDSLKEVFTPEEERRLRPLQDE